MWGSTHCGRRMKTQNLPRATEPAPTQVHESPLVSTMAIIRSSKSSRWVRYVSLDAGHLLAPHPLLLDFFGLTPEFEDGDSLQVLLNSSFLAQSSWIGGDAALTCGQQQRSVRNPRALRWICVQRLHRARAGSCYVGGFRRPLVHRLQERVACCEAGGGEIWLCSSPHRPSLSSSVSSILLCVLSLYILCATSSGSGASSDFDLSGRFHHNAFFASRGLHVAQMTNSSLVYPLLELIFSNQVCSRFTTPYILMFVLYSLKFKLFTSIRNSLKCDHSHPSTGVLLEP